MSKRLERSLAAEQGFTLIELLVSMVILALGVFALIASFDQSRGLANTSESQVAATAVAERQLDAGLALPFNKVALKTGRPPASGGTTDDTKWNNVLNYGSETAAATPSPIVPSATTPAVWNNCTAIAATPGVTGYVETLPNEERQCIVACPSGATTGLACPTASLPGAVEPYSLVTDDRGSRYKVYRYVTWVNDVTCATCLNPGLPSTTLDPSPWFGDYKRLTIAVQVIDRTSGDAATLNYKGLRKPVIVQAVKIDPTRGVANSQGTSSPFSQPGVIG